MSYKTKQRHIYLLQTATDLWKRNHGPEKMSRENGMHENKLLVLCEKEKNNFCMNCDQYHGFRPNSTNAKIMQFPH